MAQKNRGWNQGEYGGEGVLGTDRGKKKTKKTQTPGQKLEKSGEYIDEGTLDEKGNPKMNYRNLLRILQAVPAKAAQATRIGLSIAGIGGGGMYR